MVAQQRARHGPRFLSLYSRKLAGKPVILPALSDDRRVVSNPHICHLEFLGGGMERKCETRKVISEWQGNMFFAVLWICVVSMDDERLTASSDVAVGMAKLRMRSSMPTQFHDIMSPVFWADQDDCQTAATTSYKLTVQPWTSSSQCPGNPSRQTSWQVAKHSLAEITRPDNWPLLECRSISYYCERAFSLQQCNQGVWPGRREGMWGRALAKLP